MIVENLTLPNSSVEIPLQSRTTLDVTLLLQELLPLRLQVLYLELVDVKAEK
jgi:hypothetical protein